MKPAEENKKGGVEYFNPVHKMKIYEETVAMENRFLDRNKTEEFNINPFASKFFYYHYSGEYSREAKPYNSNASL